MHKPFGLTIFCDDIRREVGGKLTFVGVYGANLEIVGQLPTIIPMLSCVVQIIIPFGFQYQKFRLTIKMISDKKETTITDITSPPGPSASTEDRVIKQLLTTTISPFFVEEEGRLTVRAYFDEMEVKLGALDIQVVEPPVVDETHEIEPD